MTGTKYKDSTVVFKNEKRDRDVEISEIGKALQTLNDVIGLLDVSVEALKREIEPILDLREEKPNEIKMSNESVFTTRISAEIYDFTSRLSGVYEKVSFMRDRQKLTLLEDRIGKDDG